MPIKGANKENFLAIAAKSRLYLDEQFARRQLFRFAYDNAIADNQKWIDFLTALPDGAAVTPKMIQEWNVEASTRSWAYWQYREL